MKKIIILTTLSYSILFSGSLSSEEILNMVSKIKEERKGITLAKLENTANPFVIKEKKVVETKEEEKSVIQIVPEVVYKVDAILNRAAFINKKWYRTGDKLGNYTIGYVSQTSVTLESSSGNKVLKLEKKKKNFIHKN